MTFGRRSAIASITVSAIEPTLVSTEMAMQRSPAEPYPAETAASATMSTSASGSTIMVLRTAERLHALPVGRAVRVDVARDRGRADEAHRADVRVLEDRVDRHLVALDDVEHAVGQAGVGEQPASTSAARVLLEGLRMKVLPHAIAFAHIQIGTIAGKLNGVMPATTPAADGSRTRRRRWTPARRSRPSADAGCRRVLDILEPALHLAHRVRDDLAVLRREHRGDVDLADLEQLADPEHDLARLDSDGAPAGERVLGGLDRPSISARSAKSTSCVCSPVAGS